MRALRFVRLYALAVFFLVLAGGVILKPGQQSKGGVAASPAPPAERAAVMAAGIAP